MYYGKEENGKSRKDLIKNKDTGMQLDSKKLLWKHPDHREECGQNFVKSKLGSKLGGPKSETGEDGRRFSEEKKGREGSQDCSGQCHWGFL